MIKHLTAGIKRTFGLHRPGRNLPVYPDDVFLVSYPKSGNTWLRFLLANLLHPAERITFNNIDRIVPESGELSKRQLDAMPRPRIMKSHQYFDPRYQRVIYVVRDPRDVAVSQYHFFRKRRRIGDDYPIRDFVTRFIAGSVCDYGSWSENVSSWVSTRRNHSGFLLVKYEDMVAHTGEELSKVARFLGVKATAAQLAQAVERSSAQQMRRMETADADCSVTKDSRQDIPFVRSARAGEWATTLPAESVAELEAAWGPLMRWLGYETVTSQESRSHSEFPESVLGESRP